MSDPIKRYNGIEADPEGVYVMYEDYQAELKQANAVLTIERTRYDTELRVNDRLRAELKQASDFLKGGGKNVCSHGRVSAKECEICEALPRDLAALDKEDE